MMRPTRSARFAALLAACTCTAAGALSAAGLGVDIPRRGDDGGGIGDLDLDDPIPDLAQTVDLATVPMAQAIVEAAADGLAGREIDVALIEDQGFTSGCLGVKATAGSFEMRFSRPTIQFGLDGARFEFAIHSIDLEVVKLKMKPRVPTLSNLDPCDWSGSFEVGGSVSDIRVEAWFTPRLVLAACPRISLKDFGARVTVGNLNLKPLQNNLDALAVEMFEASMNFAVDDLLPGIVREAFNHALDGPFCQGRWALYEAYMAVLGSGVTLHHLPEEYREDLQHRFPNVDLHDVRFGYSSNQPPDNATTDCHSIYFNNAAYVDRLRAGELQEEDWDWLLHELRHTEQCTEVGGRRNYGQMWFDHLGISLLITGLSAPSASMDDLHDNMPLEDDAETRARRTVLVVGTARDAVSGDVLEGSEVLAYHAGETAGAPAARSVVRSGGYHLFLREGDWDIRVRRAGETEAVLAVESLELETDADGDGDPDLVDVDLVVGAASSASAQFVRGDADGSARIDISDAMASLSWLFTGGAAPACASAADVNDDGRVDISDPLSLLGFLFLGGAAPAAPYPSTGSDPTPDGLTCQDA